MASAKEAMKAVVAEKMHLFGSAGKAWSTSLFVRINGDYQLHIILLLCSFLIKNITAALINYQHFLQFNNWLVHFSSTCLPLVLFLFMVNCLQLYHWLEPFAGNSFHKNIRSIVRKGRLNLMSYKLSSLTF
jgi:hypothetical protein